MRKCKHCDGNLKPETVPIEGTDEVGMCWKCDSCRIVTFSEITDAATYVHNTEADRRKTMKCPQCKKGMQPLTYKYEDRSEYEWFCERCNRYRYSEIHKASPFRNISEEQRRRWLKDRI